MVGDVQDTVWPLPKFFFTVDIGGVGENLAFREVSGLEAETQVLEYRAGNSKVFSTVKMPGMVQNGTVSLKKGVFANDNRFWDWYSQIKMNTIARQSVTIKLLDQEGAPTMVWTLQNAWPTKITSPDLNAEGNEVAIEGLDLVHEGIKIENG